MGLFGAGMLNGVTAPAATLGGGLGDVGKTLGLGQQGDYYQAGQYSNPAEDQMNQLSQGYGDQSIQNQLAQYGQGNMSYQDMLKAPNSQNQQSYYDQLAQSPLTGSKFASEQVMNNPILSQLYGKGGALERAGSEEQDLAKRGYSLQPEDYEAYGQASGDIARQFGQQEQGLSQELASRGLGAASSGAAGAGYSGLMGNKMEQLARSQRDIADKRMNMNMQRLNSTRSYLSGLGNQAGQEIQNQFGRNQTGIQNKWSNLQGAAQQGLNSYGMKEGLAQASQASKANAMTPTLGQYFGAGVGKLAYNAPGMGAAMATGNPGMAGGSAPPQQKQAYNPKNDVVV